MQCLHMVDRTPEGELVCNFGAKEKVWNGDNVAVQAPADCEDWILE